MDRRVQQIKNKIDEIHDEKNFLQINLDRIMDQVHRCADLVNGSKKLRQKDCSLILKYELDILKKITEINYKLECALDESPLKQLVTTSLFENYPSVGLKMVEQKTSDTLSITETRQVESELEFDQNMPGTEKLSDLVDKQECVKLSLDLDITGSTALSRLTHCNTDVERKDCSATDAQIFRETLKMYGEKLALDPKCFSSVTDFYQKPSYCDKKCVSQIVNNGIDSTNSGLEKVVNNVKLDESCVDALQTVTCGSSNIVDMTDTSSCNRIHILDIKKNEPEYMIIKPIPEKVSTADDSSSTDWSCMNGTENSSSEEYATDEAPNCLIPLIDEHSVIVANIIDKGELKTEVNAEPVNNPSVYTAIEKLNNANFFDRQAEAVAKMLPAVKPDISLKPTEHRIKNVFETNDKKSKKKRNKKNKLTENEFYELIPKSTPELGMQCAFSHVESPNEFYIHLVDEESIFIDTLTEKLNKMLSNSHCEYDSKEEAFKAIGIFCFSYVSSDQSWYRARVVNWELESKSDEVLVQFVDYGNKRRTCYKNLRKMTKEMSDIPMLAIRCHLALMYPPQSTHANRLTEWPSATIDAMMDLSGLLLHGGMEGDKFFRIIYANQEGNSLSIDMHSLRDMEEHTVGQILLDLGLAVQIVEEYQAEHADLDYFLQDIDNMERADNINEAVMGYDPKDEARICRFTKSDGTCFKGKNCKLEHIPMSKDGFTTDKIPVFAEAMYSLPLPANGESVKIIISSYKDVCNFFAQIIWKPHKERDYLMDDDLYTLLADMNLPKTVRTYEIFKVYPAIGEIVIVKHWSRKWLRAVVREQIVENDDQSVKYQVFTVDFGEYVKVPMSDLRKIKPHFLQLPFQSVECYLHNYVAREDCDKNKAKNFFLQNIYYHNFVARIMSDSLPLKTALITFDGKDVGRILASEGFAVQRTYDKNPVNGCFLEAY